MQEIELKLQVPADLRRTIDAAVAGRTPRPRIRLQAAYQETAGRALAAARLALRLRREGRRWVQTLKGAGHDGLTRLEQNVPRGSLAAMPPVDPALHAGTPPGDGLLRLLAQAPEDPLRTLYRTDILRRTRALAVRLPGRPAGQVELAFDDGRIVAGEREIPVCELEIELLTGTPHAVIETARRWTARHGLWLDGRSKAERGDLLAQGLRVAPARGATRLALPRGIDAAAAWQRVLRNCAEQVLANASQIASGEHAPGHVHQLRVGLRRLRSAIALFEYPDPVLAEGAAVLFRGLGADRDLAVVQGEFHADVVAAMRGAGLQPRPAPIAEPPLSHARVRAPASQGFLFDLIAAMHVDAPTTSAEPVAARLAHRLGAWHKRVMRDALRYADLDDAQRHRLRKHAKRLRYGVEFSAGLFDEKGVRRYTQALRRLQETLGQVSDVQAAIAHYAPRAGTDPDAMFAVGWLAARREMLVAGAVPALKKFGKVRGFWKA